MLSVFLLVGCADLADVETNTIDSLGLTPEYAKGMAQKDLKQQALEKQKVEALSFSVAAYIKDGEFEQKDYKGILVFTSFVQTRCFDKYMDIFYPNGKLKTHTLIVNCKANGVSRGYTSDSVLRTEIPYKNGLAEGMLKAYNKKGEVIRQIRYHEGYPVL